MTDSKKSESPAGRKRLRAQIYGDRRTVSLRIDPLLHQSMMALCDELALPANTYVISLIEADLKKRRR